MDWTLFLGFALLGTAVLVFETWKAPDIALWKRLLSPVGFLLIGAFADLESEAIAWAGVSAGILLAAVGLLIFLLERD